MLKPEKQRLLRHLVVRLTRVQTMLGEKVAQDDGDVYGGHVLAAGHGVPGDTMVGPRFAFRKGVANSNRRWPSAWQVGAFLGCQ